MDAGASGAADGEPPLISAVRAGDTVLVKSLLQEDSGPDVLNAAFSLAVRMSAGIMAQLLLQNGADPGQSRQDELLSLREAVDSGSPALVEALLDSRIRGRHGESTLLEMRDLARCWYERGVETELRRLTGSQDPLVRNRVQDDDYDSVDEYSLGEMTVRDGHAAILMHLEGLLGIRTTFETLMARALNHDKDHAVWGNATIILANRRDQATWTAAAALRAHSEPSHRLFGAEVLRLTHLFDNSDEDAFAGPALDLFTDWSTREEDRAVLTEVLVALGEHCDSRAVAALVAYAGHADAGVRRAVARGFGTWPKAPAFLIDVREALLVLMTDMDTVVRCAACLTVAESGDRDPALAHAMAALLDDADRRVQVTAVYGLALHDDERCVEAARRLPPAPPGTPREDELDAVWRYEWRRDGH
ncbi:HEAT repeat domain-containing protein [Streptomyces sp. NPDC005236]|uniref:HEAT repeat domain-containing protein n=1 Tax=Streptomyces sp. NPDC005236 TaxID=3157028 RepID=UPI0033B0EEC5